MPKPVAVITGASRGIGRAIAIRLAVDYDIVAVARSDDALETLAQEIERNGGSCRPRAVDITIDGDDHRYRAVEVAVSNCGGLARAVYPSGPDIRADDGHLDVWILSMQTFPDYARYLVGILFGRRSQAQFFTAKKKVTIRTGSPMAAQADGDLIGTTPLEIDLLPAALTLVVPEEKPV